MFIYIDESGSFVCPSKPHHSYACAGALTIPERSHSRVLKGLKKLKRHWGREGEEVKGRELSEAQVAQTIHLLLENEAKFHACATDMLYNPLSVLSDRKNEQTKGMFANITDQHHPNLVLQLNEICDKMRNLPNQLFLQLCIMIELVNSHLRDMLIYFAHADPYELGSFRWIVDRKNRSRTTYEDLWHTLLVPFIQGRQFSDHVDSKIVFLEGGNYKYCQRLFKKIDKWPNHLPERSLGLRSKTAIDVVDIRPILKESFTLADSKEKPGLQLADIATNALRRAMMGNLQYAGWSDIGRLMFRWKNKTVRLVHFGSASQPSIQMSDEYCSKVMIDITKKAKYVI